MGFHVLHIKGGGYLCHFWAQKIKSGLILERGAFSLWKRKQTSITGFGKWKETALACTWMGCGAVFREEGACFEKNSHTGEERKEKKSTHGKGRKHHWKGRKFDSRTSEEKNEKRARMGKEGNTIGKEENLTAAPVKKERKKRACMGNEGNTIGKENFWQLTGEGRAFWKKKGIQKERKVAVAPLRDPKVRGNMKEEVRKESWVSEMI